MLLLGALLGEDTGITGILPASAQPPGAPGYRDALSASCNKPQRPPPTGVWDGGSGLLIWTDTQCQAGPTWRQQGLPWMLHVRNVLTKGYPDPSNALSPSLIPFPSPCTLGHSSQELAVQAALSAGCVVFCHLHFSHQVRLAGIGFLLDTAGESCLD